MFHTDPYADDSWERRSFSVIATLIRSGNLPQIRGQPGEISAFLSNLILNQRGRDWDRLFGFVLDQLREGGLNAERFNTMVRTRPLSTLARPEIAQYPGLGQALLSLERSPAAFAGTEQEAMEFVLRFLLSQTTSDWMLALYAVVKKCSGSRNVSLQEINRILTVWDYTHLFDRMAGHTGIAPRDRKWV